MPQPINYDEIVDMLTRKTEEGKVAWEPVTNPNAFTSTLDGEFTFKVSKWQDDNNNRYRLSMTDSENNEIFEVTMDEYLALGGKLAILHEAARRAALKVEEKINAVRDLLGRI